MPFRAVKNLHQNWNPFFGWIQKDFPGLQDFQEIIHLVGQQSRRLELFANVVWFIWFRRNRVRE